VTGYTIVLVSDPIGVGIALLAVALVALALVCSWRYFDSVEARCHCLVLLFLAGMVGFALTGDVFDMFVFFELMGAAAYMLTGFKVEDPTAVQGALNQLRHRQQPRRVRRADGRGAAVGCTAVGSG
jgi:multicomponent Na+:H+ antiporter subunit D